MGDLFTQQVINLFGGEAVGQEDSPDWDSAIPLEPGDAAIRTLADVMCADASRPKQCYSCRHTRWWRLKRGGPWTCGRCRAPTVGEANVEWAYGGGA